jgi:hypothetical protein
VDINNVFDTLREAHAHWLAEPVSEKLAQLFESTEARLPTNIEQASQAPSEVISVRKVALSVEVMSAPAAQARDGGDYRGRGPIRSGRCL